MNEKIEVDRADLRLLVDWADPTIFPELAPVCQRIQSLLAPARCEYVVAGMTDDNGHPIRCVLPEGHHAYKLVYGTRSCAACNHGDRWNDPLHSGVEHRAELEWEKP